MTNNVAKKDNINKLSKPNEKKYILIMSVLASFLSAFESSALSVALPSIGKHFLINGVLQNWIPLSYILVVAVLSVPFGKLAGKFGLKKFFSTGLIIFIIGLFFASFSTSADMLIIARIIQGISATMLYVTTLAMITEALPPNERGKGIGLNVSGVYIGLTLSSVIGGILTQNLGWASIFYICIPIAVIVLLLALFKVSGDWKIDAKDKFDYIGAIIYSIAIFLVFYGFTILNDLNGQISLIVGIIMFIIFIKWESRSEFPVFNLKLFKNPVFTSSSFAALITYLASFLVTYVLNYHLQYVNNYNPQTSGLILITTPILMAIIAPFAGKLSDKINSQLLAAIGASFITIAMFILIFLDYGTSNEVIIFAMLVQGIGFGLFSSPNTNAIMGAVPKKLSSVASSTVSTMRVMGQTLSLGMLTVIFTIIIGNVPIWNNLDGLIKSSHLALTFSTILCAISILCSLVGLKSKKNRS
ncbi:MAG: MFS transporter [Methanobrevibacter sp.]|jgi:EmrB/QacA subfamily drug resistance transporter|nr:MFS transporter [Methanobrevibacter sp.]